MLKLPYNEILEGQLKEVIIGNERVVLFQHENIIHAYQGNCPHEGTRLVKGIIENGHLVCPSHQWAFSCQNGQHTKSAECLKKYEVKITDNKVLLAFTPVNKTDSLKQFSTISDLPSPKGKPIVGHLLQFKSDKKHLVLENWVKESGKIYRISLLGKKFIVSADPDLNLKILKSRPNQFRRFSKISEIMEEMGVLGVFNAEGEVWEKHRKITSEALNFKNVRSYFPTISTITQRLANRWIRAAEGNEAIDVQHDMTRYTVDITSTIAFGNDTNTLEQGNDVIQKHLEKVFPMINSRITAPLPMWRFFPSKKDKELDEALHAIKQTVIQFISEAKNRLAQEPERKQNPPNFLEALLVEQEKSGNFSDKEVFGNVFTMLLAGEDTTSNSISWAVYYLAQHPKIVEKLRKEADVVFGNQLVLSNYEDLAKLEYAEAVSLETLRLRPVTPTLYMEALADVVINDLQIKKGMTVMLQNKAAQTDEKYFFKPETFMPERWLANGCPVHGAHQPDLLRAFGAGPRFCPGKTLAMNEMIIVLSMLAKNFDFQLQVKPEEVQEVFSFTLIPKNLLIRVQKRTEELV